MFDFDATLPLMALNFVLLTALLNVVFYKPLTKALDERDEYIRSNTNGAKERLAEAEALATEYEQQLAAARKESQEVIAAAQEDARKIAAEQLAEAQQEAQAQREAAQKEIDEQKQQAMAALEQQVDVLSRQILEKLVGTELVV